MGTFGHSFPTLEDRGAGVEQFRGLRSRIYQFRYETPLKTILVCSGMPSEGKSFVAANLAMSLARNSVNNILLIDATCVVLRSTTCWVLPTRRPLEYLAGTCGTPRNPAARRSRQQTGGEDRRAYFESHFHSRRQMRR